MPFNEWQRCYVRCSKRGAFTQHSLESTTDGMQALTLLEKQILPGSEKIDLRDAKAVASRLQCPLSAKQYGFEATLAPLIADACIAVCPKNPANFNVDNVRTVKMPGEHPHISWSCHMEPAQNCCADLVNLHELDLLQQSMLSILYYELCAN